VAARPQKSKEVLAQSEGGAVLSLLILLTLSLLISLVLLLSQVKRTLSSAPLVQRTRESNRKWANELSLLSIVAVIALAAVLFVAGDAGSLAVYP
jgi:uncharacterized protein involved in cysteine biosynthesis